MLVKSILHAYMCGLLGGVSWGKSWDLVQQHGRLANFYANSSLATWAHHKSYVSGRLWINKRPHIAGVKCGLGRSYVIAVFGVSDP